MTMEDQLGPSAAEEAIGPNGLRHHGDSEEDEEVIVIEEPDDRVDPPQRVAQAPRVPTQKDIGAHMDTHLPHETWCERCMKGRGRSSPHRIRKKSKKKKKRAKSPVVAEDESSTELDEAESLEVPNVGMGYLCVSGRMWGGAQRGRRADVARAKKEIP